MVRLSLLFAILCSLLACGASTPSNVVALRSEGTIVSTALLQTVAKEFYRTHPDHYDMLVIWGSDEFAPVNSFYMPVKNDLTGIGYRNVGDELFDHSADYGSTVLQGVIWIGPNWTSNTDTSEGPRSNLGILTQETGHRWAATIHYQDANTGAESSALLEDSDHWNFYLNTGLSPMGGNAWEALGNSLYRAKPATSVVFCPLDLYLMGLIASEDVGTITLLTNPHSQNSSSTSSKSIAAAKTNEEVTIEATPQEITIDQIIAVEGVRGPDTGFNATTIRQAWIYLYKTHSLTFYSDFNAVEQLRTRWYEFFNQATGGRAAIDTRLH